MCVCVSLFVSSKWVVDDDEHDEHVEHDVNVGHLDVIKGKEEGFFLYLPFSLLQRHLVKQQP